MLTQVEARMKLNSIFPTRGKFLPRVSYESYEGLRQTYHVKTAGTHYFFPVDSSYCL